MKFFSPSPTEATGVNPWRKWRSNPEGQPPRGHGCKPSTMILVLGKAVELGSPSNQDGAIAIMTVMWVSVFSLAILGTVSTLAVGELQMGGAEVASERTYYAAEAGLNQTLYDLIRNPVPGSSSLTVDGVNVNVDAQPDAVNPFRLIIISKATEPGTNSIRTLELAVVTSSFGGIHSAVQTGGGGLDMDPEAEVRGNVYANGTITGKVQGSKKSKILGDVYSSGPIGQVNNIDVSEDPQLHGKDVHAHDIVKTNMQDGSAYYTNIDGASRVGGQPCSSNPLCFPGFPDPVVTPYEIPYDYYKPVAGGTLYDQAAAGVSTPGDFIVDNSTGDRSLGPTIVQGDLEVKKGKILTLTGTVWVQGKIEIEDPNSTINVVATYNENSEALVAEGAIKMKNNANIAGSGHPLSFLLVISLSNASPAMEVRNNTSSAIFFAPNGKLELINGNDLNNATGDMVHLNNNVVVTYDQKLAFLTIPGGGSKVVTPEKTSWKEK
ncbi:MAG: hypothetical protein HY420_00345 [Candidatus Kerfeldbacteria bacterium]|nr:hypothetical protein [Candidatus Kerfeldbacteria bacterium]